MKLVFKNPHLSITPFEPVPLELLNIITGVNGSGKSHLLQAIEGRHVVIEGRENSNIVRFNYENFKLEQESAFTSQQLIQERENAWAHFQGQIKPSLEKIRKQLKQGYERARDLSKASGVPLWEVDSNPELDEYRHKVRTLFQQPSVRQKNFSPGIYSLIKSSPVGLDELSHDEFISTYRPYSVKNDFLPSQIGRIVWDYYEKQQRNRFNRFQNTEDGLSLPTLTDVEFKSLHGEKPWIVINEILADFEALDYRITTPEGHEYFSSYQLRLESISRPELKIDFQSLSSGEQVLMALVAAVYKAAADKYFPDILLLDEIDASLHPSMLQSLLNAIDRVFVKRGMVVLLVTHSPTTIALAPDQSIMVMNKSGIDRIKRVNKQDALQVLTQGFATLEQGLRLSDQIAKNRLTIISEGHNAKLIQLACKLWGFSDVDVLCGLEDMTGKEQLRTLFDFFSRTNHESKIIFVWDCDVKISVTERNNTFAYTIPPNERNLIARKGIENAFPESIFDNFVTTIRNSSGNERKEFDQREKKRFTEYIINRGELDDFFHFEGLKNKIQIILSN